VDKNYLQRDPRGHSTRLNRALFVSNDWHDCLTMQSRQSFAKFNKVNKPVAENRGNADRNLSVCLTFFLRGLISGHFFYRFSAGSLGTRAGRRVVGSHFGRLGSVSVILIRIPAATRSST